MRTLAAALVTALSLTAVALPSPAAADFDVRDFYNHIPDIDGVSLMMDRDHMAGVLDRNDWNQTTCVEIAGATGLERTAEACEKRGAPDRLIIEYVDSPVIRQSLVTYVAVYKPMPEEMSFGYGFNTHPEFTKWLGGAFGKPVKVEAERIEWQPTKGEPVQGWVIAASLRDGGDSILIESYSRQLEDNMDRLIRIGRTKGYRDMDVSNPEDIKVHKLVDPEPGYGG